MADTKQATAETVLCEECSGNGKVLAVCPDCAGSGYTPRTQPSEELRIPDDLKADYEMTSNPDECWGPAFVKELIERIARLEGGR